MVKEIDLVVPYVDSLDPNWQKEFNKYNPKTNKEGIDAPNRFRGQGDFFKYFFRSIFYNLNWIRKIHLVVQSDSQVPSWLDKEKVHIVYHKDIIPEEYLPTFNSTCIEMFLWKIKGLAEHFIYANDDMFALYPLTQDIFFDKDNGNPRFNSIKCLFNPQDIYGHHCLNSYCLAYGKEINGNIIQQFNSYSFPHAYRPYLRSKMEEAFEKNKDKILNSLSKFRNSNNINIYYFSHYLTRAGYQSPRIDFKSRCLNSDFDYSKIKSILNETNKVVTIQDTNIGDKNVYENIYLKDYFRNKFPYKSKYEK